MAGGSRGGSAPPGWYIPSRHMHTESLRAHVSAENALQDFCRPQRTRQRAIQPAAAAPASPVPVSQHCRHAYSCSSTAARPPPSLRVSAQPKSLRPAPRIAPHTTSTSAASPKPQALQPQAPSLTHAPTPRDRSPRPTRVATAQPAHASGTRTLFSPATAAQTHPHRPTQAPPVTCLSSVPAIPCWLLLL